MSAAADLIRIAGDARTVAVSGHVRPDGDCVGCCMAAALYLEKVCPQLKADILLESVPEELVGNIPYTERILTDRAAARDQYDLFLCVDTAPERLGCFRDLFDSAGRTANIDHHISNRGGGMVNVIDPAAGSACEVLYTLMDPAQIDRDIAVSLYVGIVTDTGVFRYSSTSPETHRIAAALLEHDFDHASIVRDVFYVKSFARNKVMGAALMSAQSRLGGRLITCMLSAAQREACGATEADMDGISAQMALTRGADCAILASETADGNWRCSLRSNGITDVSVIAAQFGGGGHQRAAGCTVSGDAEDILLEMECLAAMQLESAVPRI